MNADIGSIYKTEDKMTTLTIISEREAELVNENANLIYTVSINPNANKPKDEKFFVENRVYLDHKKSFHERVYPWKWNVNDKRTIKKPMNLVTTTCQPTRGVSIRLTHLNIRN